MTGSWKNASGVLEQQQQPFNGRLSETTRVGRYQKKHSPAHTHPGQRTCTSFITFLHFSGVLEKPWNFFCSQGKGNPVFSRLAHVRFFLYSTTGRPGYNTIQYKICKAPCCRGFKISRIAASLQWDPVPHIIRFIGPHEYTHLDWFSRFSTAYGCDQQTDRATTLTTGRILCYR